MCQDDLESMYKVLDGKTSVLFWCDGRASEQASSEETSKSHKRKVGNLSVSHRTKRQEIEMELDETVRKMKEKHGTKFSLLQLRLWARMIAADNHESIDNPSQVPAITGITPKREKKESLSSALAGAAAIFASALRSPSGIVNASNVDINNDSSPNNKAPRCCI